MGVTQVAGDLLTLHHDGALLGKRRFFRRLRREARQLLDGVAEEIGLPLCPRDLDAQGLDLARTRTSRVP